MRKPSAIELPPWSRTNSSVSFFFQLSTSISVSRVASLLFSLPHFLTSLPLTSLTCCYRLAYSPTQGIEIQVRSSPSSQTTSSLTRLSSFLLRSDTLDLVGRFTDHDDTVEENALASAYRTTAEDWAGQNLSPFRPFTDYLRSPLCSFFISVRFGVFYSTCGCVSVIYQRLVPLSRYSLFLSLHLLRRPKFLLLQPSAVFSRRRRRTARRSTLRIVSRCLSTTRATLRYIPLSSRSGTRRPERGER